MKIHSAELNRMMKTVTQCIDTRTQGKNANIQISNKGTMLTIRGMNGQVTAMMSTPLMGGNDERFCVDGSMFAKVCSMCNGEIDITANGTVCTIRGAGRTRLPIVNVEIPEALPVNGKIMQITGEDFQRCYGAVAYAVAADSPRMILTGVLMEIENGLVRMVALDGFQMAMETAKCSGDTFKVIVPGTFMKLIASSVAAGEEVRITTDGKRIKAETDSMVLTGGLLSGDYVDYGKILPTEFKTQALVNVEELRNALKSGSVVNSKQNLVKLEVRDALKIRNNSEEADYEAEVACRLNGDGLSIAFNQKYLMNTISAVGAEEAIMQFNNSVSPCVVKAKDGDGIHLVLPVRVFE